MDCKYIVNFVQQDIRIGFRPIEEDVGIRPSGSVDPGIGPEPPLLRFPKQIKVRSQGVLTLSLICDHYYLSYFPSITQRSENDGLCLFLTV